LGKNGLSLRWLFSPAQHMVHCLPKIVFAGPISRCNFFVRYKGITA
jgi:hypothetical protein